MSAAPFPEAGHAGLMDRVYRRQRHVYDLTRKYYLFGRDGLIRSLDLKGQERLVEIGCGTARNLIAIARACPGARLYGLDASATMLKTASAQVEEAGLGHRIRLEHGLAEHFSPIRFDTEAFENIMFSYSLSMIPDWRGALAAARAGLTDDGRLHIVDFGDFKGLPTPARAALRTWLGFFHVRPRVELVAALESSAGFHALPGRYAFTFVG